MTERESIEKAIEALENQRGTLGGDIVDTAIGPLRGKLASLEEEAYRAERKLVTVMFADISGFTLLSERNDPETVRDLMNRCFERLVPCIRQFDGTIDKYIGDEVMPLFGAPVAHENDPERALRAALAMQSALQDFNATNGTDLGIHFGINTGLVLAGTVGTPDRRDYSVMGDAVNLASRLEDLSERGQVLVGADTWRHASRLFDFEALQPVSVKGKSEPVAVFLLKGELKREASGRSQEPGNAAAPAARAPEGRGLGGRGLYSPLVGRDAEYSAVQGALKGLAGGTGGIIGIIGEAGLGKSRLIAEVREHLPEGILWLEGKALSYCSSTSYYPFRQIIRSLAGISDDESDASSWKKLESAITPLFPDADIDYPAFIATTLAIDVPPERARLLANVDGEAFGKRIFLSMWRLFERVARRTPTALILEDLHWIDASSSALLEHILALATEVPLLVIWLSRPDPDLLSERFRQSCAGRFPGRFLELRLEALGKGESEKLVANLLRLDDLPESVGDGIIGKAEGNPFFVEEIIRTLLDAGAVVPDASTGRYRATAALKAVRIPDTLQGVIMARIDRLDDRTKDVLRTASVIGRAFLYRLLKALKEDSEGIVLDGILAELQRVELIREKDRLPELEYIFKHALAQEATYDSILLQTRRDLHRRIAAALELLFADRLDEFYGLLAYHYARAEAWDKAQAYLMKAGDQAGRMAADGEALAHYTQAMEAYAKAFGDTWDPLVRARLYGNIGEAFYRKGEGAKAEEYLGKALESIGCIPARAGKSAWPGIAKELAIQVGLRLKSALTGPGQTREQSETDELRFRYGEKLGWLYTVSGHDKALHLILYLSNMVERSGYAEGMVEAWAGLAWSFIMFRMPWLASLYIRLATGRSSACRELAPQGVYYQVRANLLHTRGRWKEAIGCYEAAIPLYHKMGNLWGWGNALGSPVSLHRLMGDCRGQTARLREAIELCRDTGDPKGLVGLLQCLAHVLVYAGPVDEAIAIANESRELAVRLNAKDNFVDGGGELGFALVRTGRHDEAVAMLEECVRIIGHEKVGGTFPTQPLGAMALAYLAKAEESAQAGEAVFRAWMAKARPACKAALGQGKWDLTGLMRAMRYQARYEWLLGRKHSAARWWKRARKTAARLGAVYETAMVDYESGWRLGDEASLERAARRLDGMGAALDRDDALRELERLRSGAARGARAPAGS